MGRPSKYSEELIDEICSRITEAESLTSICQSDHMPSIAVLFTWLKEKPEFQDKYARAKEIQADFLFERMRDVAETQELGIMTKISDRGTETTEADMIAHRKLKIETYKWQIGKMRPKKYGDKQQVEHTGDVTHRNIEIVTKDEIDNDDIGFKES